MCIFYETYISSELYINTGRIKLINCTMFERSKDNGN